MASAGARASITGVWGRGPQRGPGQSPWSWGLVGGAKPPQKLKVFLVLHVSYGSIFAVFIRVSADKCMTLPEI